MYECSKTNLKRIYLAPPESEFGLVLSCYEFEFKLETACENLAGTKLTTEEIKGGWSSTVHLRSEEESTLRANFLQNDNVNDKRLLKYYIKNFIL